MKTKKRLLLPLILAAAIAMTSCSENSGQDSSQDQDEIISSLNERIEQLEGETPETVNDGGATTTAATTEKPVTTAATTKKPVTTTTVATTKKAATTTTTTAEPEEEIIIERTCPEAFTSNDGRYSLWCNTGVVSRYDGQTGEWEQYEGNAKWITTMGGYYAIKVDFPIPISHTDYDVNAMMNVERSLDTMTICLPVNTVYEGRVYNADELWSDWSSPADSSYMRFRDTCDVNNLIDDESVNVFKDSDVTLVVEQFKKDSYITVSFTYNGYNDCYQFDDNGYMVLDGNRDPVITREYWTFDGYIGAQYAADYTDAEGYSAIIRNAGSVIESIWDNGSSDEDGSSADSTCGYCHGSGICQVCKGVGTTSHYGHIATCTNCAGTGNCPSCS